MTTEYQVLELLSHPAGISSEIVKVQGVEHTVGISQQLGSAHANDFDLVLTDATPDEIKAALGAPSCKATGVIVRKNPSFAFQK